MRIEENARSRSLQRRRKMVTSRIPSKFPERPIAVRSDRSCKGDKPSENRGSGFHNAKNNDNENPENRDMRFRDLILTVRLEAGILDRRQICNGHVAARKPYRSFGDRDFIMQRTMTTKTPKSRYAISRFDRRPLDLRK